MENNNHKKRKVMLIAAFAVAVIALAGVGYAAVTQYKATSVNSNNTAQTLYITATQNDYESTFSTAEGTGVEFNTYTDTAYNETNNKILYTLKGATTITGTSYKGVQIGSAITLTVANNGNTDVSYTSYNLAISTGALGGTSIVGENAVGWIYIMKIENTSGSTFLYYGLKDAAAWTDAEGNDPSVTIIEGNNTVSLYISAVNVFDDDTAWPGKIIDQIDDYTGMPTSVVDPEDELFNGVNVIFTVTGNTAGA